MIIGLTLNAQNYTIKDGVVIFSDTILSENPSYEAARNFFIQENLYRDVTVIYDSENHIAGVTIHNYLPWFELAQYSRIVIDVTITDKQYTIKIMAAKRYLQRDMSRAGGYVNHSNMYELEPIDKKHELGKVEGYKVFKAYQELCSEIIEHFKKNIRG